MIKRLTDLTPEYVRARFSYCPTTGALRWANGPRAGRIAGNVNAHGYRNIKIDKVSYRAHRVVWLHVYGEWPAIDIDHINNDRLDNRISNLRIASRADQCRNRLARKVPTSSGVKGVFKISDTRWAAHICVNYRVKKLGNFKTKEKAQDAYEKAAREFFGAFAKPAIGVAKQQPREAL